MFKRTQAPSRDASGHCKASKKDSEGRLQSRPSSKKASRLSGVAECRGTEGPAELQMQGSEGSDRQDQQVDLMQTRYCPPNPQKLLNGNHTGGLDISVYRLHAPRRLCTSCIDEFCLPLTALVRPVMDGVSRKVYGVSTKIPLNAPAPKTVPMTL